LSFCVPTSFPGILNSLSKPHYSQVRLGIVFGQRIPALSSGHFQEPLEPIKNIKKASKSSVPVLSAGPLYFLLSTLLATFNSLGCFGFFAYLANCFGFPARPCTCMPAGAASSCALPWYLVSRPVSRQSRLRTFVFPGKTGGFAADGVGFELVAWIFYALRLR